MPHEFLQQKYITRRSAASAGRDENVVGNWSLPCHSREAEHDAQIYRAYLKKWKRIEQEGGSNPRVMLDFELKAEIQKSLHAMRKAGPDKDLSAIKQQVAEQFDLKFIDDSIRIPDVRIEDDLDLVHGILDL